MARIIKYGVCIMNDSVNTRKYVTVTLQDLFNWDITQASNCVNIIDHKGEYVVKWFDSESIAIYIAKILKMKGLKTKLVVDKTQTI